MVLYLERKLSLAAWIFKQQPFHFELLSNETPAMEQVVYVVYEAEHVEQRIDNIAMN